MKRDRLEQRDLVQLFKQEGLAVDEKFAEYLTARVFNYSSLSLKELTQVFAPVVMEEVPRETSERLRGPEERELSASYLKGKIGEKYRNNEKSASDIDKILEKYRSPSKAQPQNLLPEPREPSPNHNLSPYDKYAINKR
jgi:hypothetical protein